MKILPFFDSPLHIITSIRQKNLTIVGIAICFISMLSSCTSYYQVVNITAVNSQAQKDNFVFENDTLKVIYYFWQQRGVMSFAIYNKLSTPIYIDWKKSSFVRNNVKNDYWQDVEHYESVSHTSSVQVSSNIFTPQYATVENGRVVTYGNLTNVGLGESVSSSAGTKRKPERITFIAPKSESAWTTYYIGRINGVVLDKATPPIELQRLDNKKKKTRAYIEEYTQDESPIDFRNFVTLSTKESFENEFYLDNEFYISKIMEVNNKQFAATAENESLYFDGKNYYVVIPNENSVEVRTHPMKGL